MVQLAEQLAGLYRARLGHAGEGAPRPGSLEGMRDGVRGIVQRAEEEQARWGGRMRAKGQTKGADGRREGRGVLYQSNKHPRDHKNRDQKKITAWLERGWTSACGGLLNLCKHMSAVVELHAFVVQGPRINPSGP